MDTRAVAMQCNLSFNGGKLGKGMRLNARRPALACTDVCLYVFPFIVFIRLAFWGKEMGGVLVFALCHVVCFMR